MPFRYDQDEGLSDADAERFGGDGVYTRRCPDCGAEVIDEADICPRCFMFLGEDAPRRSRRGRGVFHDKWRALVVVLVIAGLLAGYGLYRILR